MGMNLKELIKSPKEILDVGTWRDGDIKPKTAFPVKFRVRPKHRWKIIRFSCLDKTYKLLILYRIDKEIYFAWLAVELSKEVAIVAKYEYHATHPGWHMHVIERCKIEYAQAGRTGGFPLRFPRGKAFHRRADFGIQTDDEAQAKAVDAFGLGRTEGGLFG